MHHPQNRKSDEFCLDIVLDFDLILKQIVGVVNEE